MLVVLWDSKVPLAINCYTQSLFALVSLKIIQQKDKMGLFIAQNQDRVSFIQGRECQYGKKS